jgi:Mrp family chromosome partitioning ATPase
LHRLFGTPESPGLTSVLKDGASLDDVAVFPSTPQLVVVSAGKPIPGTSLDHKRLAVAIAEVRDSFSFIIVDTAPVNTHSDVLLLSSYLDCVALVVEAERTDRHTLRETIAELTRVQARLLGVVLNRQKSYLPKSLVKR